MSIEDRGAQWQLISIDQGRLRSGDMRLKRGLSQGDTSNSNGDTADNPARGEGHTDGELC